MKSRLLIQMQYDASTNNYPNSFPIPTLLLKIANPEDEILDLIYKCKDMVKEEKIYTIREYAKMVNSLPLDKDVIVNMGEYPADADRFFYFELFLEQIMRPIKLMGTYSTINSNRALQFNNLIKGDIIEITPTDFDIRGIEIPDYYLENYPQPLNKKRAVMRITWGCPQHCKMCPVPAIYGGKYKYSRPEVVTEEIKKLYDRGVRYITFTDDNISAGTKRFVAIFNKVESLNLKGLKFHSQEGFEVTAFKNDEFCKIVAKPAWEQVKLGVENIKADFLKKIGKYYYNPDDIEIALTNIKKYNVKNVRFFYLIGLDETREDVMDNLRYFSKHGIQLRTNILRKYEGTDLNEMQWETKMTVQEMKRYSAMAYAITWLSFFKIDMFDPESFDKFFKQEKNYSYIDHEDFVEIKTIKKFSFQVGRIAMAFKGLYESKHDISDTTTELPNEQTIIVRKSQKKEVVSIESNQWF